MCPPDNEPAVCLNQPQLRLRVARDLRSNVAQGYANPSDAQADNFNFSWYPFDLLEGTQTQSFETTFDSTVTIWCIAQDLQNNCIWTDTITVQVAEAVDIGLPADTLVCDLDGFTLQPSAEAQSMGNISWNWGPPCCCSTPRRPPQPCSSMPFGGTTSRRPPHRRGTAL